MRIESHARKCKSSKIKLVNSKLVNSKLTFAMLYGKC